MKAILYARFSPRPDSESSQSNELQLEACRAYCQRNEYEVVEEFDDAEMSGADEDRPALWDAVNAIRPGMVLVVHKSDRLARSVYLSEIIRRDVENRGGSIEFVVGANGTSAEDVLLRQVLQAFSEYERKVIAARTKAAMLRAQDNGESRSSIPPFGKQFGQSIQIPGRRHPTRLLEDEEFEQEVIRIVLLFHQAKVSLREIANWLNDKGYDARGELFRHKLIGSIIRRAIRQGAYKEIVKT